jgi:hypothetical protein
VGRDAGFEQFAGKIVALLESTYRGERGRRVTTMILLHGEGFQEGKEEVVGGSEPDRGVEGC